MNFEEIENNKEKKKYFILIYLTFILLYDILFFVVCLRRILLLVGNAIIGQSGGPTSAINATLSGVIRGASSSKSIKKLFGMKNGIEGFLNENLVDLSYLFDNEEQLFLLESTPSSALGSCRVRLPNIEEDPEFYKRIFEFFKRNDIRYFLYIGGNDSMDTVSKINEYSKICDYEIRVIGIPKTIDNDLVITDHTPGFGSAAKYIATTIKEIASDTAAYLSKSVTIVEIMGRDSGWLAASAGLPKYFGNEGADLIYLPEIDFDNEKFISSVNKLLYKKSSVVIAVSEGIKYSSGIYVSENAKGVDADAFGHKSLAGAGKALELLIKEHIGCKVRSVELNLPQRCSSHIASATDILESISIGKYAVECAVNGISGKMVIFKRKSSKHYEIELSYENVEKIANQVKYLPANYMCPDKSNVTRECMEYIAPLIIGERNIKYENGLPVHFKIRG